MFSTLKFFPILVCDCIISEGLGCLSALDGSCFPLQGQWGK